MLRRHRISRRAFPSSRGNAGTGAPRRARRLWRPCAEPAPAPANSRNLRRGIRDSRRKVGKGVPDFSIEQGRDAMGIDPITTAELSQAVRRIRRISWAHGATSLSDARRDYALA